MDQKNNVQKELHPNVFRVGLVNAGNEYIPVDFGRADIELDKLTDSNVTLLARAMIAPEQMLNFIGHLIAGGIHYQKATGNDIGFAPFMEPPAGDDDEI